MYWNGLFRVIRIKNRLKLEFFRHRTGFCRVLFCFFWSTRIGPSRLEAGSVDSWSRLSLLVGWWCSRALLFIGRHVCDPREDDPSLDWSTTLAIHSRFDRHHLDGTFLPPSLFSFFYLFIFVCLFVCLFVCFFRGSPSLFPKWDRGFRGSSFLGWPRFCLIEFDWAFRFC